MSSESDILRVYPEGTPVKFGNKPHFYSGKITGVTLRGTRLLYEVSYFTPNHDYKQIWLSEIEFRPGKGKSQKIGFKIKQPN